MRMPLTVVLVRTLYPSNIGATSRAMVNMGFERLVLVEPKCEVNSQAHKSAAGAQGPMENRIVYPTWGDFYAHEGGGIRIGLTRRGGKLRNVTLLAETLADYTHEQEGVQEKALSQPIYLFLGPENNGLSNEETLLFQHCCSIPTYGEMGSLNLAQAALIALFIVRQVLESPGSVCRTETNVHHGTQVATPELKPFYFPEETLREWLEVLGFDLSSHKINALTNLKRLLAQTHGASEDFSLLESIVQQTLRKLREIQS